MKENTAPPSPGQVRAELLGWFVGQLPDGWFGAPPSVSFDNDEILVVGELPRPDLGDEPADGARAAAELARIDRFREDTRDVRMRVAEQAQQRYGRKVSWGALCGTTTRWFTTASVPVMTRLRITERQVLDTLIDAGVARSRSDALAWCVRLVGRNESSWIAELREAFEHVEQVRAKGPRSVNGEAATGEAASNEAAGGEAASNEAAGGTGSPPPA